MNDKLGQLYTILQNMFPGATKIFVSWDRRSIRAEAEYEIVFDTAPYSYKASVCKQISNDANAQVYDHISEVRL